MKRIRNFSPSQGVLSTDKGSSKHYSSCVPTLRKVGARGELHLVWKRVLRASVALSGACGRGRGRGRGLVGAPAESGNGQSSQGRARDKCQKGSVGVSWQLLHKPGRWDPAELALYGGSAPWVGRWHGYTWPP